jgi:hypothetical protein
MTIEKHFCTFRQTYLMRCRPGQVSWSCAAVKFTTEREYQLSTRSFPTSGETRSWDLAYRTRTVYPQVIPLG